MITNTAAFTPEIIKKIARYKDDQQALGRPPKGGYFVKDGCIMFYKGTRDNVIIKTSLNHFDGKYYYIADNLAGENFGEDEVLGFEGLSAELLEKY